MEKTMKRKKLPGKNFGENGFGIGVFVSCQDGTVFLGIGRQTFAHPNQRIRQAFQHLINLKTN